MKRVYKYILEAKELQTIRIPSNQILSIESQMNDIVVYALVDLEQSKEFKYEFVVYGTGHDININIEDYKFLGTVKMHNDSLMFHAFYKRI